MFQNTWDKMAPSEPELRGDEDANFVNGTLLIRTAIVATRIATNPCVRAVAKGVISGTADISHAKRPHDFIVSC